MENYYNVVTLKERFDLFEDADQICIAAWPEFMLQDPVAIEHWMTFIEAYKEYQLLIMENDTIVAVVNTVPLCYDGDEHDLSDEGWDWGIKKAVADLNSGTAFNTLMGVQVVVNPVAQGKGVSQFATRQMHGLVAKHGLKRLIIPVRPNRKPDYPLIPMEEYITWKNEYGLQFDSWLRVHQSCGGRIVKVCHRAMEIIGTIAEWNEWTGKKFPGSGSYLIDGALNPITVDIVKDTGVYIEPNVWVVYDAVLSS